MQKMRNFRFTFIALASVLVLAAAFYITPEYVRKAIFYQFPDIDDYKIFDNRTVIAGSYRPWIISEDAANKSLTADQEMDLEKYKTVAFLVIRDREIVFEKYWDSYSAASMSVGFSVTKSIMSLLVGIAIDEGYIKSVEQGVGDFIPEYKADDLKYIKIRHLLQMGSGLNWKDSYRNPFGNTAKSYYGNDLKSMVFSLKPEQKPDLNFAYKNGNTQLLAFVLEKAVGMSVSAYASLKLWKPLGAKRDAYWSLDEVKGIEKAFCGFNTTARDFARFGQLVLNKGKWDGRQLLSEKYLNEALSPASHLIDKNGDPVSYYGYQWWLSRHEGMEVYSMRGYKGQYVIIIPEKNLVIVRLGHKSASLKDGFIVPSDMRTWMEIGLDVSDNN